MVKFIQTSSRQDRERSFSTSFFPKKRIISPTSLLARGDTLLDFKTRIKNQIPSRLLSCVKVYLGPVDAATFFTRRVEVLDCAAISQVNVINRSLFQEFEVRFMSFIDRIVSGNFDILYNVLSNFVKFVSLSLYSVKFYVSDLVFRYLI